MMAKWRCLRCGASGTSRQPEQALREHWAWDCPEQAGRQTYDLFPGSGAVSAAIAQGVLL